MNGLIIERGAIARAGETVLEYLGRSCARAAVIADDITGALYGGALTDSLARAGLDARLYALKNGENSKNLSVYADILGFFASCGLTRADCALALGGGVVGDVAGFAAATYMRGINLINVPTTLLACLDSAIGGKTAINLPSGKNLAGAFYPPVLTLIDPDTLSTLPSEARSDGAAEALKYACVCDHSLLPLVLNMDDNLTEVISRAARIKLEIIARDMFDTGDRQLLNFGHTLGHAIEKHSDYTVSHGRAVAVGMAVMARACALAGLCAVGDRDILLSALDGLGLPSAYDADFDAVWARCALDKKREADYITLIVMRAFGRCERARVRLNDARDMLVKGWRA